MALPKLCVTVAARRLEDLRRQRDAVADADLVELRLDALERPDVAGALAGRRRPVVVTCRPAWEGGAFQGSEEERQRLLAEALAMGADYVDVEWRAGFDGLVASTGGQRIVLSHHDFDGVPADIDARLRAMRATGAEVVKLAVMAHRLADTVAVLARADSGAPPTILLAMGEAGLASRVLASRFRACWTYAGEGLAPGQIPASRLVRELGFRRLTPQTAVYGVVGRPVSHSLSPALHNRAFAAAGLDAVYLPLAAASFDDFLQFADAFGVQGASVTLPFKLDAFDRADEADAVSRRIGSVNTLKRQGRRWLACNTDVAGFLAPLEAAVPLAGRRATVLGAGGAARAAAHGLVSAGARVTVAARQAERAAQVAATVGASTGPWPPAPGSWDVLVNATPVGTVPAAAESPLPGGPFDGKVVYDLVYNPPRTRLLAEAAAAGCITISGLAMLVAQAERQFEWWTGIGGMRRPMREALDASTGVTPGTSTAPGAPQPGHESAPTG